MFYYKNESINIRLVFSPAGCEIPSCHPYINYPAPCFRPFCLSSPSPHTPPPTQPPRTLPPYPLPGRARLRIKGLK